MNMIEAASEYESVKEQVLAEFASLSEPQLNWKPSESSWSVGQCLDHLILSKRFFMPDLDRVSCGDRVNSFWEEWSPLRALSTKLYLSYMRSNKTKVKVPSKEIVPPSRIPADIVERFVRQQDEIISKIAGIPEEVARRTTLSSPFLKAFTYRLADGLLILAEHDRRHIRQALRVIGTEGFPKD